MTQKKLPLEVREHSSTADTEETERIRLGLQHLRLQSEATAVQRGLMLCTDCGGRSRVYDTTVGRYVCLNCE